MLHPHTRTPRTHIHGQRRCIIIISTKTHLPSLTHRKQQKNDIKSTKKPWKNNSCSTQSNCRITSGHKTMPKIASETTFAKHKRTHARAWNVHASATDERIAYVCVWACECVSVLVWDRIRGDLWHFGANCVDVDVEDFARCQLVCGTDSCIIPYIRKYVCEHMYKARCTLPPKTPHKSRVPRFRSSNLKFGMSSFAADRLWVCVSTAEGSTCSRNYA